MLATKELGSLLWACVGPRRLISPGHPLGELAGGRPKGADEGSLSPSNEDVLLFGDHWSGR